MRVIITENQLKNVINRTILNETSGELEKYYVKTGIFDDEDRNVIMNITNGDNFTKLIADMYYYFAGKYNKELVEPRRLSARDIEILENTHRRLKEYNKNVIPIHDLYAKEHNAHPLEKMNDLDWRERIIERIKQLPSLLVRNLRGDIRKERTHYELEGLFHTIKEIQNSLKLVGQTKPEHREKIEKKIFSSANDTFDGVKKRLEDTTIPYLSQDDASEGIVEKVRDIGDEAEILYNQDNILVVKINSAEAMGYIGCSSQWCFASNPQQYWDNYTGEGGFATIVFNFNEEPSEPTAMVVVLEEGSVYNMYNDFMEDGEEYLIDIGVHNIIQRGEMELSESFDIEKQIDGFIYHGTGKGQALNIQKDGFMKPNRTGEEHPSISFTKSFNYSKYYATVKGGSNKMVILRTKLTNDFILSPKILNNKGDEYVTFKKVSTNDLEILCPDNKWRPLNEWDVIFDEPKINLN